MSSGLPDFGRNLTFHCLRRDYRGFQMGEQTEQHTDCSSDRCFPCTHDRCLTALVYLRTCTVGECLRINDLHFLVARWRRTLVCPRFRILPALAGLLGGIMLFVAGLNHLNPEITPLVPVLQSYWLMSHVAIIMIGYVFFALCALTGLFNLILMNLLSATNRVKLLFRIREFTLLNEMAMILGLFFMTAGTFLGAIWANVSWGRYWGWDPKETWALISIVVYALVLHIRFIPLLKGKTTWCFNLLSVVSILSIIMTWFGVNYYLSGLHSYGKTEGGDLLLWIWGAGLCVVLVLALFARRRLKKYS